MTGKLCDKDILEKSLAQPWYFEMLVKRYQIPFLRKSFAMVKNREEAEDIVQETFVRIYKHALDFKEKPGASFNSWAYAILTNTALTHYKKQKRRAQIEELVGERDFADASMLGQKTETERHVERILGMMPAHFSRILRLYFLEERSQKEIAEMEHITPEAVRTRVYRAKNFWRNLSVKTI